MKFRLEPSMIKENIILHIEDNFLILKFNNTDIKNIDIEKAKLQEKINSIREEKNSFTYSDENNILKGYYESLVPIQNEMKQLANNITELLISGSQDVTEKIERLKVIKASETEILGNIKSLQEKVVAFNDLLTHDLQNAKEELSSLYREREVRENFLYNIRNEITKRGIHHFYIDKTTYGFNKSLSMAIKLLELAKNIKAYITPSFYNYYLEIIDERERTDRGIAKIKCLDLSNPPYPDDFSPTIPFLHQKIGFNYSINIPNSALFWEMGTGKTKTCIDVINWKLRNKEIEKAIIIAPLSLLINWSNEIKKHSNLTCTILRGTKKAKVDSLTRNYNIYLISYESVTSIKNDLIEYLQNFNFLMAIDESSKIKNIRTKRTRNIIDLSALACSRLLLTGTPITQHAHDLFSQYLYLDQGATFGNNINDFLDLYFYKDGWFLRPRIGALDTISDKAYKKATRFLKKDCLDLPQKIYTTRIVEMQPEQKRIYMEMVNRCIAELDGSENNISKATIVLVQLLRLSQITSGFVKNIIDEYVDIPGPNPKLEALKELIEDINGRSLIIWARFNKDITNISNLLDEMNISYVTLSGDVKVANRAKNVDDFQDKKVQIIIGNAQTGGFGLNLTAASDVVFYSNDYSLSNRLQAEDRCHRIGQTEPVTYTDIICDESIDILIRKVLAGKKSIADIITKDNVRWLQDALSGNLDDFLKGIISNM